MAKKQTHFIMIKVSAPPELTAAEVRREIRALVNDQCNYSADEGDIRVQKASAVPASWVGK